MGSWMTSLHGVCPPSNTLPDGSVVAALFISFFPVAWVFGFAQMRKPCHKQIVTTLNLTSMHDWVWSTARSSSAAASLEMKSQFSHSRTCATRKEEPTASSVSQNPEISLSSAAATSEWNYSNFVLFPISTLFPFVLSVCQLAIGSTPLHSDLWPWPDVLCALDLILIGVLIAVHPCESHCPWKW